MGLSPQRGAVSVASLPSPVAEALSKTRSAFGLGRALLGSFFPQLEQTHGLEHQPVPGPSLALTMGPRISGWGQFPAPGAWKLKILPPLPPLLLCSLFFSVWWWLWLPGPQLCLHPKTLILGLERPLWLWDPFGSPWGGDRRTEAEQAGGDGGEVFGKAFAAVLLQH